MDTEVEVRTLSEVEVRTLSEVEVRTLSEVEVRTLSEIEIRTLSEVEVSSSSGDYILRLHSGALGFAQNPIDRTFRRGLNFTIFVNR